MRLDIILLHPALFRLAMNPFSPSKEKEESLKSKIVGCTANVWTLAEAAV